MDKNRTTALALFLAILGLELALSGAGHSIWRALWSGPYPLGQALSATPANDSLASTANTTGGSGSK